MDNKCSKAVKQHIQSNTLAIKLNPPHSNCINAAKWATGTFKEHFVFTLATVDILSTSTLGQISPTG